MSAERKPAIDCWGTDLPSVTELHRDCHPDDGVFVDWLDKQPRGHYSTSTTIAARSMRMGYELGRIVERRDQGNSLARTQLLETVNREECRQFRAELTERRAKDALVAELVRVVQRTCDKWPETAKSFGLSAALAALRGKDGA